MRMYEGDLLPELVVSLTDDAGPIDVSGASRVRLIAVQNGAVLFDKDIDPKPADGIITYQWVDGETDNVGDIHIEVQITWGGGKPQTIKSEDVVEVKSTYAEVIDSVV